MLIARILFAVAALNLIFLVSELTMNVAQGLLRLNRREHATERSFLIRQCKP